MIIRKFTHYRTIFFITHLFVFFILISCLTNKSTFNQNEKIAKLGTPVKLEYYAHAAGPAFQFPDTPDFIISDKEELRSAMNEIENADHPEPWKGAGWNRIKIYYPDTVLKLNTDNLKIGLSASGEFYYLSKDNFITNRIGKK